MKKGFIILNTAILLFIPMNVNMTGMQKVEAAETHEVCGMSVNEEGIVPYADVIVKKYRLNNGRLEYRRWNETKGYWVDSEWLPVE